MRYVIVETILCCVYIEADTENAAREIYLDMPLEERISHSNGITVEEEGV